MLHPSFLKPEYGSTCFADIPELLYSCLTDESTSIQGEWLKTRLPHSRYDAVIFLLIDSFGWRYYEKYAERYPFLQQFAQNGIVAKWTSQFPSTTAAHVTTIHTGLPVGQSGIFEWIYYEPKLDAVIAPLLFSHAGETKRDTLRSSITNPASIYPAQTLYLRFNSAGVDSNILQHAEYTPSTYSDIMFQGASVFPYRTFPEALANLHLLLEQMDRPTYFFLYFDKIDTLSHTYGPESVQVEAEVDALLTSLQRLLLDGFTGFANRASASKILLIMSADHGQIEVNPETTVYLNLEPRFSTIRPLLRRDRKGKPLVPAGCPRDMFLYVEDQALEDVHGLLSEGLSEIASVFYTQSLVDEGYFGPGPYMDGLADRIGNLVILPHAYESVWWYEEGKFDMLLHGHHGGLTAQETEIPLMLFEV